MDVFWEVSWGVAPPFDFLHFIFGSTIVFPEKRRADNGKEESEFQVNIRFLCPHVPATLYIFSGKVDKN